MKRNQLRKLKDFRVRIRPIARCFDEEGEELEQEDDTWGVGHASSDGVVLYNLRTSHLIAIMADAIHHYQEDVGDRRGILHLHVQVFLQGRRATIEPLVYPQRAVAYLPIRRPVRRRVAIPIAGTRNPKAEATAAVILGLLLIVALRGWSR